MAKCTLIYYNIRNIRNKQLTFTTTAMSETSLRHGYSANYIHDCLNLSYVCTCLYCVIADYDVFYSVEHEQEATVSSYRIFCTSSE